jgi:hypothetical protein
MTYWGDNPDPNTDPHTETMTCPCGLTGTCHTPDKLCNCDSNDDEWRFDEGWLTYKDDLPVTYFHAGDTGSFL